jgi:amidophosphoribosyltransferase
MEPGERYISRVRSNHAQPIQDVFAQINDRVNEEMAAHPEYADNVALQKQIFRMWELFLGMFVTEHLEKNSIECSSFYVRTTGCTGI